MCGETKYFLLRNCVSKARETTVVGSLHAPFGGLPFGLLLFSPLSPNQLAPTNKLWRRGPPSNSLVTPLPPFPSSPQRRERRPPNLLLLPLLRLQRTEIEGRGLFLDRVRRSCGPTAPNEAERRVENKRGRMRKANSGYRKKGGKEKIPSTD